MISNQFDYTCIKHATLDGRKLSGTGYALATFQSVATDALTFAFVLQCPSTVVLVFGFQGVGNHLRFEISPTCEACILYWVREGIPVYLQHASMKLPNGTSIRIEWSSCAIRVFANELCFINIVAAEITSGLWGFSTTSRPYELPPLRVERHPSPRFKWVILGDGYSNNRWRNRHFFSWPELAFGHRGEDYLNACIAAGNSRRVLQIVDQIGRDFAGSDVILAAGADDLIENTPTEESMARISEIVQRVKQLEAKRIHICAIPPRTERDADVRARNQGLANIAKLQAHSFIDFHAMLAIESHSLLVRGDYPGEHAQKIIARGVISHLGIGGDLSPLEAAPRPVHLQGISARIANHLTTGINRALGRIPNFDHV